MVLHSFRPVLPKFRLSQKESVDWILKVHLQSHALTKNSEQDVDFFTKLKRFTIKENDIKERFSDYGDLSEDWESHQIYRLTSSTPSGVSMELRGKFFSQQVERVMEILYCDNTPAHIIHVTCTGYVSPSPVQVYFSQRSQSLAISHAYHMGCYASLPAIRMAQALAWSQQEKVDIVHTELCSLHLNPALHTAEQMVVQSLFADGHIKYSVDGESEEGLLIRAIHEKLIPHSSEDMTWTPGQFGMLMSLSRDVPFKIRDALPLFLEELCEKAQLEMGDILKEALFAIHPGGPKIIEAIQKKCNLSSEQIRFSQKILYERGNMSSATLPHIWGEILESRPGNGKRVVSLAFGPGLTIFGAIFEVKEK